MAESKTWSVCLLTFAVTVVIVDAATLKWSPLLQAKRRKPSQHAPVDPEVFMDSTQLITSKGYPCENHYVTTQDGFILNMQRIPHSRHPLPNTGGERPVVMLQHGLEASSSNWLDNLVNESLAYLLADAGADVWLGNIRGNMYSRNHTHLRPDQKQFWAWSWDHMAAYDLPAMVDHVIRTSGARKVHYIGHSQGTMIGFAGFSNNHTLASFIERFYALAPVAKVCHIEGLLRYLSPYANDVALAFERLGCYDFLPYNKKLMDSVAQYVCQDLVDILCENFLFILGGYDRTHLNETRVPVYVAHNPGGTSVQNMLHFAQGVDKDKFQMFDYGSARANMNHYHQPTPPEYDLSKFNVPTVTYAGGHDTLADPTDVAWLLDQVAHSVVAKNTIPSWEHLDFIWAFDAPKYCYNDILSWVFKQSH